RRPSLLLSHATSPSHTSTLSLHDALPISPDHGRHRERGAAGASASRIAHPRPHGAPDEGPRHSPRRCQGRRAPPGGPHAGRDGADRKSTRLNSSHRTISYAVFCLKKKKSP